MTGWKGHFRAGDPGVREVARRRDDGGDGGDLPARRGAPRGFSLQGAGERRAVGAGLRGPAGEGDRAGARDPFRRGAIRSGGRGAGPPRRSTLPHVRHPFRTALVPDPDAGLPAAGAAGISCAGSRGRPRRTSPAWRASGPTPRAPRSTVFSGTQRNFSSERWRRSRGWSAKPMRGIGAKRSGPRSRSSTASNPGYADRRSRK